jgi:hypothetical protein
MAGRAWIVRFDALNLADFCLSHNLHRAVNNSVALHSGFAEPASRFCVKIFTRELRRAIRS